MNIFTALKYLDDNVSNLLKSVAERCASRTTGAGPLVTIHDVYHAIVDLVNAELAADPFQADLDPADDPTIHDAISAPPLPAEAATDAPSDDVEYPELVPAPVPYIDVGTDSDSF